MSYCTQCGGELADGDQFCAVCGRSATGAVSAAASEGSSNSIEVPTWMAEGWRTATTRAFSAGVIGVAIQYVIGLVLVLGIVASLQGSSTTIEWGELLRAPFFVWLGMHGAVEGNAMWITAIVWIVVAFYLTRRFDLGTPPGTQDSQGRAVVAAINAAKSAIVYSFIVIIFLVVLDPNAVSFGSVVGPSGSAASWNPAGAFFSTLFVVFLGIWGIDMYAQRPSGTSEGILGLIQSASRGTLTIVLSSVLGLLALVLVGATLDLLGEGGEILSWFGSVLVWLLVAIVLWAGADVGLALMASAMEFFPDDAAISTAEGLLGDPSWLIAGSAIVAAAFVWGGYRAARSTGSLELDRILQAAGLAGIGVAAAFAVASFVVGSRIEEIKAGIGLSLLWTFVALGGGLIYAQSVGALESAMPTVAAAPNASDGGVCTSCQSGMPADAAFCANCGTSA